MQETTSLKKKTISGMLWSFTDLMANQGIQFIIQVILARLLLPEHFGLIGMILVFIAVSNVIIDSGFTTALIREKNPSNEDYSTIFFSNLLIALIVYGALYMSANAISSFINEPKLTLILRVLSLGIIINSFGIIQRTILTRKVNFKTQTKINIIAGFISGAIAISLALEGYGVWSLVIKALSMQLIQTILLWILNKWIPTFVFNINSLKRLFGFSWKVLISNLIGTLYNNLYYIVIGKFFSASQLGYYTNAVRLRDIPSVTVTSAVQRVSYPVLSKVQEDNEILKNTFRKVIKLTIFIVFPLMIGLATVASPVINLVFGDKWMPSVLYLQLLCLAGMLYPLHAINGNILQVKGRSDLYLKLEIIKYSIMAFLIIISLWLKLGILGLIGAAVLHSYITLLISIYFTAREITYTVKEQLKDITPIFVASLTTGGILYYCGMVLPEGNLIKLFSQVFIGVFVYVIICKLAKIEELNYIYGNALSLLKGRRSRSSS